MSLVQEIKEFKLILAKNLNITFSSLWQTNQLFLPILTSQVFEFSIMAATSVPSESSFSVAGIIHCKQRASMLPETLKYCMLLKNHKEVLKQLDELD